MPECKKCGAEISQRRFNGTGFCAPCYNTAYYKENRDGLLIDCRIRYQRRKEKGYVIKPNTIMVKCKGFDGHDCEEMIPNTWYYGQCHRCRTRQLQIERKYQKQKPQEIDLSKRVSITSYTLQRQYGSRFCDTVKKIISGEITIT